MHMQFPRNLLMANIFTINMYTQEIAHFKEKVTQPKFHVIGQQY